MTAKPCTALAGLALVLSACQNSPETPPAAPATPEPTVTPTAAAPAITLPTPTPTHSKAVVVTPEPTACGAEMLQNYLNLLPTSTAKDEIARTLGHNRVRYVPLQQAKAEAAPTSTRVSAGLGVDGRIKEFSCG